MIDKSNIKFLIYAFFYNINSSNSTAIFHLFVGYIYCLYANRSKGG